MPDFFRLFLGAAGVHAAEQLALAALPLTAVLALGADPSIVGALVAAQGAAWLIVTLPGGVLLDRWGPRRLLRGAPVLAIAGSLLATSAALAGNAIGLGVGAFIAAAGTVLFTLAANAAVPLIVTGALASANARIELARALSALGAPIVIGWLAALHAAEYGYALAAGAAAFAALGASRLAVASPPAPRREPAWRALRQGAAFAWNHGLLRGLLVCAVFWNLAFFGLLAIFVPYALTVLGHDARGAGLALSAYGAGMVIGATAAPRVLARVSPRVVLVAGPALSLAAALALAFHLPAAPGLFLIGFGPMLWLVCQTGLRQSVTPPALFGRVTATIQIAIYGVRPLGALAAGWIATRFGLETAMALVVVGFALSVAAVLASPLVRLAAMPPRAALVGAARSP